MPDSVTIGVLALQGSFREHITCLNKIDGVKGIEVRTAAELATCAGLIIPGGESTTMALVAEQWGLIPQLQQFAGNGRPVWGTCAGLIFLANRASGASSSVLQKLLPKILAAQAPKRAAKRCWAVWTATCNAIFLEPRSTALRRSYQRHHASLVQMLAHFAQCLSEPLPCWKPGLMWRCLLSITSPRLSARLVAGMMPWQWLCGPACSWQPRFTPSSPVT